ncbi:MAG: ParA family protein [Acidobacteriota bacterium]|nr:ParA family protein [Blastocatellia bacterium]MDW8413252.1 ParA family protein [Acidobacteriota bacterium]
MKDPRTIAIFNQAGGVGKSTLARDLGYELSSRGRSVLLVDADPQASLTEFLGLDSQQLEKSLFEALVYREPVPIHRVYGLDLIPSTIDLATADFLLNAEIGRELRLREVLRTVKRNYQIILIDAPPSLGNISINVLVAADEVLIPVQCEIKALRGAKHLFATVEKVRMLNPELRITGVVPTLLDARTRLNQETYEVIRTRFGTNLRVFPPIRRGIAFAEASARAMPVQLHAPRYDGCSDIRKLAEELLDG